MLSGNLTLYFFLSEYPSVVLYYEFGPYIKKLFFNSGSK